MRIGLLGPIIVTTDDGVAVAIGGQRVSALLALLAADVGRTVPDSRLVDGIWGEDPPATARNALQSLIRRLRLTLPGDLIQRVVGGYLLAADPDSVDGRRFSRLCALGQEQLKAGAPEAAMHRFDSALMLWRGPALSGHTDSSELRSIAAMFTEERLRAIELRADAYLAVGRSGEILRELASEVAAQPLRETLVLRLITVLIAGGQTTAASNLFTRTRELLHNELGIEPSAELRHAAATLATAAVPARSVVRVTNDVAESAAATHDRLEGHAPTRKRLPSGDATIATIPRRLTSFVGRERDCEQLADMLTDHRLVTLVGSGGVGKTRLATELARALSHRWPGGCAFVDLAALSRERPDAPATTAVAAALLAAVGPGTDTDTTGSDWAEALATTLRGRPTLLILDNCEHVVSAAAEASSQLLQRATTLTLLATSREPLDVEGERLYPVRTLLIPDITTGSKQARESAAVELLLDRARAVRPDFELTEDNCADICAIVRGLDGVPLAIELAAARLKAMPLDIIANRLGDGFRLLTNGTRHATPRHRTLHAAIAWSWELLIEPEARLARRLSVFAGGATLASIETVCADPSDAASNQGDRSVLIHTLTSLVTKSLVEFDGERYRMVDTIRAFASAELAVRADDLSLQRRHADHFIELVEAGADGMRGRQQGAWLTRLTVEHGNAAAALRWAIDSTDIERALRLFANLIWYWRLTAQHSEVSAWRPEVMAVVGNQPPAGYTGDWLVCRYSEYQPGYDQYSWWGRIPEGDDFDHFAPIARQEPRGLPPILTLVHALRERHRGNPTPLRECTGAQDKWLQGSALVLEAFEKIDRCQVRPAMEDLDAAALALADAGDPRALSRALVFSALVRVRMDGLAAAEPAITRVTESLLGYFGVKQRVLLLCSTAQIYLVGGDRAAGANYLALAEAAATPDVREHVQWYLAFIHGDLALQLGDPTTAAEYYAQVFGDPDSPQPAVTERPTTAALADDIFWRAQYAVALARSGRPKTALRLLNIARTMAGPASPMLLADIGLGYAHVALGSDAPAAAMRLVAAIRQMNKRIGRNGMNAELDAIIETARKANHDKASEVGNGSEPPDERHRSLHAAAPSPSEELSARLESIIPTFA